MNATEVVRLKNNFKRGLKSKIWRQWSASMVTTLPCIMSVVAVATLNSQHWIGVEFCRMNECFTFSLSSSVVILCWIRVFCFEVNVCCVWISSGRLRSSVRKVIGKCHFAVENNQGRFWIHKSASNSCNNIIPIYRSLVSRVTYLERFATNLSLHQFLFII